MIGDRRGWVQADDRVKKVVFELQVLPEHYVKIEADFVVFDARQIDHLGAVIHAVHGLGAHLQKERGANAGAASDIQDTLAAGAVTEEKIARNQGMPFTAEGMGAEISIHGHLHCKKSSGRPNQVRAKRDLAPVRTTQHIRRVRARPLILEDRKSTRLNSSHVRISYA